MARTLKSLAALGPWRWPYRDCIRTRHFQWRSWERGFNERLLPELWISGVWHDDGQAVVIEKYFPGVGTWELVVDFDPDFVTPILTTVRFGGLRCA